MSNNNRKALQEELKELYKELKACSKDDNIALAGTNFVAEVQSELDKANAIIANIKKEGVERKARKEKEKERRAKRKAKKEKEEKEERARRKAKKKKEHKNVDPGKEKEDSEEEEEEEEVTTLKEFDFSPDKEEDGDGDSDEEKKKRKDTMNVGLTDSGSPVVEGKTELENGVEAGVVLSPDKIAAFAKKEWDIEVGPYSAEIPVVAGVDLEVEVGFKFTAGIGIEADYKPKSGEAKIEAKAEIKTEGYVSVGLELANLIDVKGKGTLIGAVESSAMVDSEGNLELNGISGDIKFKLELEYGLLQEHIDLIEDFNDYIEEISDEITIPTDKLRGHIEVGEWDLLSFKSASYQNGSLAKPEFKAGKDVEKALEGLIDIYNWITDKIEYITDFFGKIGETVEKVGDGINVLMEDASDRMNVGVFEVNDGPYEYGQDIKFIVKLWVSKKHISTFDYKLTFDSGLYFNGALVDNIGTRKFEINDSGGDYSEEFVQCIGSNDDSMRNLKSIFRKYKYKTVILNKGKFVLKSSVVIDGETVNVTPIVMQIKFPKDLDMGQFQMTEEEIKIDDMMEDARKVFSK